jgi:hypothetical protein
LTSDSVTIKVNAVIYYRIYDAVMAVTNVADVHNASNLLAQSLLRNILGTRNLVSILAELENISNAMQVFTYTKWPFLLNMALSCRVDVVTNNVISITGTVG